MHLGKPLFSSLMSKLLGSGHVTSSFCHHPLQGGDFYGRAEPRVNTVWQYTLESSYDIPRSLEWHGAKNMHLVWLMIKMVYGMPMVAVKKLLSNTSPKA